MLESIPTRNVHIEVFRLAVNFEVDEFLRKSGIDAPGIGEMADLLRARKISDSPEDLCDGPFRPKRRISRTAYAASRFSDGSFPVFYSSREVRTAEAEVRHWIPKYSRGLADPHTSWYTRFACDFDGAAKDLRPKKREWPELVHDHDYRFCNGLGAEARAMSLDGLVTPSARQEEGTNVPVFARRAISKPRDYVLVAVSYDPTTGETSVHEY